MLPGHQRQTPRRGEIERARIARHFADDEGKVAAAQPFFHGEQRLFRAGGGNVDQAVTQGARQAGAIGPPSKPPGLGILDPQPRTLVRYVGGGIGCGGAQAIKRESQRHGGAAGFSARCEHLAMQGAVR